MRTLWAWARVLLLQVCFGKHPSAGTWGISQSGHAYSLPFFQMKSIFWSFCGERENPSVPDLTSERGLRESLTGPPGFSLVSFSFIANRHGKAGETALHAGEWGFLLPLPCAESSHHTCAWELLVLSSFPLAASLHLTEVGLIIPVPPGCPLQTA